MGKRTIITLRAIVIILTCWLALGTQTARSDTVLNDINTKNYPNVKLLLSGTAFDEEEKAGSGYQAVKVSENEQAVKGLRVSPLMIKPKPIAVVLLIDSSGSMKGKPIADAKAAAGHFVRLMGSDDQISVIAFSSKPNLVADYNSNKKRVINSINAIQASGETAVYDALSLAARQIKTSGLKQNYIVLLSDGGDTVSRTKPLICIDQLRALKVPVYTIALKSPEFDIGTLENISSQSGGKLLQAINSDELNPFYSRIAEQIKNNIEIEYRSPGFDTKDIDLDITIGQGSKLLHINAAYQNPTFLDGDKAGDPPVRIKPIVDNWLARSGIILVAFLASSLFIYGAIAVFTRQRSLLKQQMGMYEQIWSQAQNGNKNEPSDTNPYISKALGVIGYLAEKRGFVELARVKLEQAGLPLRPVEYIFFHALIVLVPSILLQVLFSKLALTLLFIILLTILPMLFVQVSIDRRKNRFNEMLPDTISMLAGSLRAGYSMLQAISLASEESKPPISDEFKRVLSETRLGLSIEVALNKMAARVESDDFHWMVLAINIQREVGGNLAEILDIVAKTIRERETLKRQIKTLTAEGRLSSYILIALPFAITAILLVINPGYMSLLFTNVLGWIMAGVAGILMIIGIIWMRKIVSIEV